MVPRHSGQIPIIILFSLSLLGIVRQKQLEITILTQKPHSHTRLLTSWKAAAILDIYNAN